MSSSANCFYVGNRNGNGVKGEISLIEEALIVGVFASGVRMSIPILFAALGENIAERSGVLNLGVEGMMLLGAFSGFMGTYLTGNIVVGLLMAMGGAAALAALMAFLSVTIRTNQLAAGLAVWLLGVGLAASFIQTVFWRCNDRSQYTFF